METKVIIRSRVMVDSIWSCSYRSMFWRCDQIQSTITVRRVLQSSRWRHDVRWHSAPPCDARRQHSCRPVHSRRLYFRQLQNERAMNMNDADEMNLTSKSKNLVALERSVLDGAQSCRFLKSSLYCIASPSGVYHLLLRTSSFSTFSLCRKIQQVFQVRTASR